jgi:hypothetical protein
VMEEMMNVNQRKWEKKPNLAKRKWDPQLLLG